MQTFKNFVICFIIIIEKQNSILKVDFWRIENSGILTEMYHHHLFLDSFLFLSSNLGRSILKWSQNVSVQMYPGKKGEK